jgi:RNA polymerase sigma factor (sigma-70 family)
MQKLQLQVLEIELDEVELARARHGNQCAMNNLCRACYPRVRQTVLVRWRHYALSTVAMCTSVDDLVQDCMVRLCASIAAFQGGVVDLPKWISCIVRNLILDIIRQSSRVRRRIGRKLETEFDAADAADANNEHDPQEVVSAAEVGSKIRLAIERLPSHWRAIVVLRYVHAKSFRAIAEDLHMASENAARFQGVRALSRLRCMLTSSYC